MSRACGMHGGEELCIYGFGGETEESKPSGRVMMYWVFKRESGGERTGFMWL